ncbi:MAG: MFS transporter [Defluviitaleaceae bacterium]|nr:MFS transporter [Defluviitaleaceae bacterium]
MNKKNKKILLGMFYTFFVCGFIALMLGAILPSLMEAYELDYDIAGLFFSANSVGSLLASFVVGFFAPKLGLKKTIIIFSPLVFLAYIGVATTNIVFLLIPLFVFVGLGLGCVNNINNFILSGLAENKPEYISLSHMFFAIGAFVSPFLASLIMASGFGFKNIIYIGIILAISMVLIYFVLPVGDFSAKVNKVERNTAEKPFYKHVNFYLAGFLLFFYLGMEMGISGFLVAYLTDYLSLDFDFATRQLSFLWLMIILGRLLTAYLSSKIKKTTILLISTLGAIATFVGFLLVSNPATITLIVLAFGLFISSIFPMTIASVSGILKQSSSAMGAFLAIVGLGGIFVPMIIGFLAHRFTIMTGMRSVIVSVVLMVLCAILLKVSVITNINSKHLHNSSQRKKYP